MWLPSIVCYSHSVSLGFLIPQPRLGKACPHRTSLKVASLHDSVGKRPGCVNSRPWPTWDIISLPCSDFANTPHDQCLGSWDLTQNRFVHAAPASYETMPSRSWPFTPQTRRDTGRPFLPRTRAGFTMSPLNEMSPSSVLLAILGLP